jgi:outer membrane lipoprotein-sorting protein
MTSNPNTNFEFRLASLGRSFAGDSDFVQQVLNRIERENIRPDRSASRELKGWIMRGAVGLAAAILLGFAIWSILVETPEPAYGIEGVVQRVLSLDSLHLKGVTYATDGPHPIELFAQQPDRCRVSRSTDQSGRSGIASTDLIIAADQHVTLDAHAKTAMIQPENSEDARGEVAEILQSEVQMMFGAARIFTKARSERLNGIQTDVYESRIESIMRDEIWFNPKTGLPVKTVVYRMEAGQPDRILGEFDTIEPNPWIDPAVFSPAIPSDYKLVPL